jgi:signal transduction histidine kinase/ActR/RegA family two-component response regulator
MPHPSHRRLVLRSRAVAHLLLAGVVAVAAALLLQGRRESLERADERLRQVVAAAESEVNRSLMSVDLVLAGLRDVLQPALMNAGFDAEAVHERLSRLQERQLLFSDLALVDESGSTLTTALPATRRSGPALPRGFVQQVRGTPVPALVVGEPLLGTGSGERSLLLARPLDLPGAPPLVAVAEVPSALLLSAAATSAAPRGLSLALERADGMVLAVQPPDDRVIGQRFGALDSRLADGQVRPGLRRSDGVAVRSVMQSSLYPGLFIMAVQSEEDALAEWRQGRSTVIAVAGAFMALVLVVAWAAERQMVRLAQARQQAADAAALLDRALESMGDAFLLCDAEDRVVRWNVRYAELFPWLAALLAPGVSFRQLAESAAAARFGAQQRSERLAWVEERMAAHGQLGKESQQVLADGTVVSVVERRMPDGGTVSVYRDMSAAEKRLAAAKAEAESANEAKSQFLANMSHEIRTPLNAVLGLNEMLLLSELKPEQRRHAELVRTSGQLLLSLINDILDLSRIEAGHFESRQEPFDPQRVALEVLALLEERALAQGLGLSLDDGGPAAAGGIDGLELLGDAVRLRQVLFNLVGNALKFTERGGVTVRLRASAPDSRGRCELTLQVADTGIGIAPEQLPRLFERFTQADNSATRRHGGSGLGLAITREVVEKLGGRISATSMLGQGSVFTAVLPLQAAPGRSAVAPDTRPGDLHNVGSSLRVLVAEDNLVNQVLIEAILTHLGHRCTLVGNGLQAVEAVAAGSFDLVLMDMQMPELDGIEATRRIRTLAGAVAHISVIAMTANAHDEDRQLCLQAGMDDFLPKPVDIGALGQALQRARDSRRLARVAAVG